VRGPYYLLTYSCSIVSYLIREAVFREVLTKLGAEMEEALLLPPRALLPQATVVSLQSHGHGNADRTAPLAMCPEHRCRRVA
jgi:hypothetical protein